MNTFSDGTIAAILDLESMKLDLKDSETGRILHTTEIDKSTLKADVEKIMFSQAEYSLLIFTKTYATHIHILSIAMFKISISTGMKL